MSQTHPSNGPQTRTQHSTTKSFIRPGKSLVFSGHELIYYQSTLVSCVFRVTFDDDGGYDDDDGDDDADDDDDDDDHDGDDDGELEIARASPQEVGFIFSLTPASA